MENKLSPRLYIEYRTLLSARRQRVIDAEEFAQGKARIMKEQSKLERKRQVAAQKREAVRVEKERLAAIEKEKAAKLKAEERKKKVFRRKNKPIFDEVMGEEPYVTLSNLRQAIGDRMEARVITDNIEITVPGGLSFKHFIEFFREGGSGDEFLKIHPGERVLVFEPSRIQANKMRQMFLDGVVHCVFDPLIKHLKLKLENSKGKEQQIRLTQRRNRMLVLQEEFKKGVPEEEMENVAKQSGFKITIYDRLNQDGNIYNKAGKEGSISLTNSRENHLDEGILVNNETKPISFEEMKKKWIMVKENKGNIYATIQNGMIKNVPRELHLLNEGYKIYDPEDEIYERMNEVVKNYYLDAIKYPDVNEFIKAGRIINSSPCFINDIEAEHHLDMPKAYTQFKKCRYYMGFLGMIHQWRCGSFDREFITKHIGYYRVRTLNENRLTKIMNLTGTHVLPSPEILAYLDRGIQFEIDAGVYGSRFDFEFPEEMLEDKKKRYAIWTGKLGCEYPNDTFTFTGSKRWAEHLAYKHGEKNVTYYADSGMIRVNVPKKRLFTRHHIFGFITSYLRIQMLDAIDAIGIDNVQKVVMDGIYFKGDVPESIKWFKTKDKIKHSYFTPWYDNIDIQISWCKNWLDDTTVLAGQGGAGKTYKVLNDGCFNDILYVSPQHVLGRKNKDAYGILYTTIHKLIGAEIQGKKCRPYKEEFTVAPVIIIDELTQIEGEWIDKAIEMYSESLIIIVGDIKKKGDKVMWYQCRNGTPDKGFSKIWNPTCNIIHIDGDRRSRDDTLKELKLKLRDKMDEYFIDGDSGENDMIRSWALKNLKTVSFDDACNMFQSGDIWIAGKNATSDLLLSKNVMSGWYKKGGNVEFDGDWSNESYEKRGSFTIHSFQGQTVETGKVFISIRDTFEYTMLYTAMSRPVNFEQLVFVR